MPNDTPPPVWPLETELGEGNVWVERDRALWFVDVSPEAITEQWLIGALFEFRPNVPGVPCPLARF